MMRMLVAPLIAALLIVGLPPPAAGQNRERLDALFEELSGAENETAAGAVAQRIWGAWYAYDGPSDTVIPMMFRGRMAMGLGRSDIAEAAFSAVITADSDYSEGWNARATARYTLGNFNGSIADIHETLAREPRHFGALAGLGLCFLGLGQEDRALAAFEAALAVNAFMPAIAAHRDRLTLRLQGNPI